MSRTVLYGGRVFDGTGSPVAEGDVAFEDGRIVAVGTGLDGDDGVDVAGCTLLPGLLEAAKNGVQLPHGVLAKAEGVIDAHNASFAAAAAGVKIAMGTDSGVGPHGSNLRELELMAAGGMAPQQVLAATTSSAAELLGVQADTGTLTPGKLADIVVTAGDPFDFGRLKENVRAVYLGGRLVRGQPGAPTRR